MAPDSSQAYVGYSGNTKRKCIGPSGRQLCPAQQQTSSVPARKGRTNLLHWTEEHSSVPAGVCRGFHSQLCLRSPVRIPALTPAPEREHFTFQPGQGQGVVLGQDQESWGWRPAAAPRLGGRMVLLETAGAGRAQAGHRARGPGAASPGEQRHQQHFPCWAAGYALG